jgi:hypothetical protein
MMKLSQLKPCACCGGPLTNGGGLTWPVIRISQALLNPKAANQVMGMTQYFGGALKLAEVMTPDPDAVKIIGDEKDGEWKEVHVCLDCFISKFGRLPDISED